MDIEPKPAAPTHAVMTFEDLARFLGLGMQPRAILTVRDLMDRWRVSSDTIYAHVDNPDNPLPTLPLGSSGGSNRSMTRFRLSAVEEWEAGRERRTARPSEPAAPPPGRPAWFDGKVHTGKVASKPGRAKGA